MCSVARTAGCSRLPVGAQRRRPGVGGLGGVPEVERRQLQVHDARSWRRGSTCRRRGGARSSRPRPARRRWSRPAGGFLEPARRQEDGDADGAADKGVAAAGQQQLGDVDVPGAGGDRQGGRGDEHGGQPVVADHDQLDHQLQGRHDQREPQALRVQPEDARRERQTHPGAPEPVGAAPQGPAAVDALMQDEDRGCDRPVRMAEPQQRWRRRRRAAPRSRPAP